MNSGMVCSRVRGEAGLMVFRKHVGFFGLVICALAIGMPKPAYSGESEAVWDIPEPASVLFIGNSLTYYNNSLHNHLRKMVVWNRRVDTSRVFFRSMTISGGKLSDHLSAAKPMISDYRHKRKSGPWDLVVLQGYSNEAIDPRGVENFQKSAQGLSALIRQSGSKPAFFMTWAYRDSPDMAKPLVDAYTKLGKQLDALVIPVGLAFEYARRTNPDMSLYQDNKHPSLLGTYLAACVFYTTLYGEAPFGSVYAAGLTNEEAAFAQVTAWLAVQMYFKSEY
jgi:hypothetical protein